MPVALQVAAPHPRRVPLVRDPFRLGRGAEADLVLDEPRASAVHAEVRLRKGEYLIAGSGGEPVFVNGKRVPVMALRHGDEVRLVDPSLGEAAVLRFENHLAGAFVPPGASLAAAWMAHPAFRRPDHGPDRYGPGTPVGGREASRCRLVREPHSARRLLLKILGRLRDAEEGDAHLALLAALAGAPHPSLVPVVDGGLAPAADGPVRWIATVWVEGECLRDRLASGEPLPPPAALRVLLALSGALAHLHARGAIHADVAPANVVLPPAGPAVLIDPGHALLADSPRRSVAGVVGTPGYLAPEAVLVGPGALSPASDVYGLAAVGYAALTGRPPAAGADVLEVLARSAAPPPRPRDLGVDLPPPLESVLLEALAPEPRARPSARALERGLLFAQASLGLGGVP